MSHTKKLPRFFIVPNTGEKQLANRPMHSKRIEIINTNQSVPKKNKIVQAEIGGGPPEAGGSPLGTKSKKTPRRPSVTQKSTAPPRTKSVPARKPKSRCRPRQDEGPSHQMKKFACAPTLFPSAAADSLCRATQTQIGSKPSDNSSPNQARAEPILIRLNPCNPGFLKEECLTTDFTDGHG
jgi:hypothetical protein